MSFQNPSGSYESESGGGPVAVLTPLTGTVVAIKSNQRDIYVNTATLAALTVALPQVGSGQRINILFAAVVTLLSITDRLGNVVATAPVAAALGQSIELRYISKTIGWVRWR